MKYITSLILSTLLLPISPIHSQPTPNYNSVTLQWDQSSDTNTSGLILHYNYYSNNSLLSNSITCPPTSTSTTLSNISPNVVYNFYLVATNSQGLISEPSNLVRFIYITSTNKSILFNPLTIISNNNFIEFTTQTTNGISSLIYSNNYPNLIHYNYTNTLPTTNTIKDLLSFISPDIANNSTITNFISFHSYIIPPPPPTLLYP